MSGKEELFKPSDIADIEAMMDGVVEELRSNLETNRDNLHMDLHDRKSVVDEFMSDTNRWNPKRMSDLADSQSKIQRSFATFVESLFLAANESVDRQTDLLVAFEIADYAQYAFNMEIVNSATSINSEILDDEINDILNSEHAKAIEKSKRLFAKYILEVGWKYYNGGM